MRGFNCEFGEHGVCLVNYCQCSCHITDRRVSKLDDLLMDHRHTSKDVIRCGIKSLILELGLYCYSPDELGEDAFELLDASRLNKLLNEPPQT